MNKKNSPIRKTSNKKFGTNKILPNTNMFSPPIKPKKHPKNSKRLTLMDNNGYKEFDKLYNSKEDKTKPDSPYPPHSTFAQYTKTGKIEGNLKDNNQDSAVLLNNIFDLDYCVYAIMDGHGFNGHFVSQLVKKNIEEYFTKKENYCKNSETISLDIIKHALKKNDYTQIKKFYKKCQDDLLDSTFDTHFSGTTCVIVFKIGNTIICSNVGDSRAMIVKKNNNDFLNEKLSEDQKPENPKEKERIEANNGCILKCDDDPDGPWRIFQKGEKFPGIAMARSLGDEVGHSCGVSYEPEIIEKNIDNNYKYVVVASDGIWEFLDNDAVMTILNPFFNNEDAEGAVRAITKIAIKKWEEDDNYQDDITIILAFFNK